MHLHPIFLLVAISPVFSLVRAGWAHHNGVRHISNQFHRAVIRRSADLATDTRIALRGLVAGKPSKRRRLTRRSIVDASYCVAVTYHNGHLNPPVISNGTGIDPSPSAPTGTSTTAGNPAATTSSPSGKSSFNLVQNYSGDNFFAGWTFITGADDTGGVVTYVDQGTGQAANLISTANGSAIMRVETTPQVSGNRQSIRIQTQYSFNGGLVIMDSVHAPTGCGTWPAFWTNGPNWPTTGEIDIMEGVNNYTSNQATLHTNAGCELPNTNLQSLGASGVLVSGTDCAAASTGNQGCGIRDFNSNSFGSAFNANGGGVYAMLWDTTGISVYFFPRNVVPPDIEAGAPHPESWGVPMAHWPASSCNPFEFFQSHSAIFDTTLCGQWAGAVWSTAGVSGQTESCAQSTGVATCEDYVLQNGAALTDAYWEVKSVKIYQPK